MTGRYWSEWKMCDASSMLMHTSLRDSAGRNMAR
jgi:hypothetical protein